MKKDIFYKIIPTLRIPSAVRISLDSELKRQFQKLQEGIVLEVGSGTSSYRKLIPHTKYMTLDIEEKNNPDICCDSHDIKWESNYFDTVSIGTSL